MSVASLICYVSRLKEDAGDGSSEETDASESTCDGRNGCGIYNRVFWTARTAPHFCDKVH